MGAYSSKGAYCKLLALTWGLIRGEGAYFKQLALTWELIRGRGQYRAEGAKSRINGIRKSSVSITYT